MEKQPARHAADEPNSGGGLFSWLGVVVAILLALFLVWWLPARVASGYAVPRITGSVVSLPSRLPVLWVRSWPWQTTPPAARVTFNFSSGAHVTVDATASAPLVGWLSGRAVPATLTLSKAGPLTPSQIVGIAVAWAGGSSSAAEPAFWVSARGDQGSAPGASAIWTDRLSSASRVGVELPIAQNPDVILLSSPDPVLSPWASAKCFPATQDAGSALLSGRAPHKLVSCGSLQSGNAVVVAAALPHSYTFVVWQPVVQEVINTHIRSLVAGPVEIGSTHPMTAQNWWQFTTQPLPPGF